MPPPIGLRVMAAWGHEWRAWKREQSTHWLSLQPAWDTHRILTIHWSFPSPRYLWGSILPTLAGKVLLHTHKVLMATNPHPFPPSQGSRLTANPNNTLPRAGRNNIFPMNPLVHGCTVKTVGPTGFIFGTEVGFDGGPLILCISWSQAKGQGPKSGYS